MSLNPFNVEGKTIFITGASSGIGQCTAIILSKMGARLIITGRQKEKLKHTFDALHGDHHEMHVADLTDPTHLEDLLHKLPEIDGLFYSSGISGMFPLKYISDESIQQMYNINTFIPLKITRYLVRNKKINNGGSLLYMSSIGAFMGIPGQISYASSKASILGFVQVLATELSSKKIRANCLCPGMVETPLLENSPISDARYEEDKKSYPLGYGKPEDIAYAAVYFLSDASRWVTGTHLLMDGGAILR